MIYFSLIFEFFKIGVFSFGGGYATIPFLYHISEIYGWYTVKELTDMIAIASMTPGPVGINVATYAGLKTSGIFGSLCTTLSEILPSLFLVIILSKVLNKFSRNFYVKSAIETLKPLSCALLVSVSVGLLRPQLIDFKAIALLIVLIILSIKSKKEPLFYMLIAGGTGLILKFAGI